MNAGPPLLELRQLSKRFGRNQVIDNLSLTVAAGETVGVIGPNGAGKTTLFNMVAGALQPTGGDVCFEDTSIVGVPAHQRCHRGIARTFQIPQSFAQMTLFENVLVGAEYGARRRQGAPRDLAAAALRRTGLLGRCNELAGTVGLLAQKRLELARALATAPRVLLLDEVAGGLTDEEKRDLLALISDLKHGDLTILWIEHAVDALASCVERLIAIDFGTVIADGPPDAVLDDANVQERYLGVEVAA